MTSETFKISSSSSDSAIASYPPLKVHAPVDLLLPGSAAPPPLKVHKPGDLLRPGSAALPLLEAHFQNLHLEPALLIPASLSLASVAASS